MKRLSSLKTLRFGALGLLALVAACSESSMAPVSSNSTKTPVAAVVEATAVASQSGLAGADVTAPAVLVKDNKGQPMVGVTVRFIVVQGGGSVQNGTAVTNFQGIATSGRWTLGATAGTNLVDAVVGTLAPVRFTATATEPAPPVLPPTLPPAPTPSGTFNITVRYIATPTARQQQAVTNAIARWQSVIQGDLVNIPVNAPAAACFSTQPALNEVVDDVLILIEFVNIDGPGKTLGEAGPCYVRSDNSLPVVGHLKLDAGDLQQMETWGTLDAVVMHEIGHILGIGTLWTTKQLIAGAGTDDPQFLGARGNAAFRLLGGSTANAPIENTGEAGTRDGHWRESIFGSELMTGYINSGSNPISTLTIASLQDIGYGANTGAAGSYTLGAGTGRVMTQIDLEHAEKVKLPKFKIDKAGRHTKLPY
jgi:hypothetical protein